jgi:hypothetical protein
VVTGRVLDSLCLGPVVYANVLVLGTRYGAMSLKDGRFTIAGLPPGRHRIRAMMMGFMSTEDTVTVVAGSSTTRNIVLEPMGVNRTQPTRPTDTKRCEVHGTEMSAVSVLVSYGCMVVDPDAEAAALEFPNADPYGPDGGSGRSVGDPLVAWAYRCEGCVQLRNEWLNGGSWALEFDEAPSGWATCDVDGAVEFRVPPGLVPVAADDDCVEMKEWVGDGIRVKVEYGHWPHVLNPERGDENGDVIVGDTYVRIAVREDDDGARTLSAGFQAPPSGDRMLRVDIVVAKEDLLKTACAIVGSIRFLGDPQ